MGRENPRKAAGRGTSPPADRDNIALGYRESQLPALKKGTGEMREAAGITRYNSFKPRLHILHTVGVKRLKLKKMVIHMIKYTVIC